MEKAIHRPILAGIFSLLLPGLGQFYNHEIKKALAFISIFLFLSYFYSPIGFFIMIATAIESYTRAKILKEKGFISKNLNLSIIILIAIFMCAFFVGFFAISL